MTTSPDRPCANILRNPIHFLALGFGSGCAPKAPGTFGTLAAIPLYLPLQHLALGYYIALVIVTFILGVWVCGRTSRDLGVHDHPSIVWDEVVGYFITMLGAPHGVGWMILGFGLFRLFDIVKPWPIKAADKHVGGGFGIMFDDVLAAVYAWLILQGVAFFSGGG
ncbi:MAG: phosphatidylglycerophosphatase A [Gammaproteobacteria bacterium]|nr:phosphatidylglycerophosphatase A [Gammaproteobacteria bacterium]MCP5424409.1 phosphatidylglycerophosphatase A [Gammaproteobacteria bacterium]MCP5458403.1 phosphatidylglycerophosphatase A [Gammaproteobacteria bacterium]